MKGAKRCGIIRNYMNALVVFARSVLCDEAIYDKQESIAPNDMSLRLLPLAYLRSPRKVRLGQAQQAPSNARNDC
jgi:hypothetical protein